MPRGTGKKTSLAGGGYTLWRLPNGLKIDGKSFAIATDFRTAIAYAAAAEAGELTEESFYQLWFPDKRPENLNHAIEAVGLFYNLGEASLEENSGPPPYDLVQDAAPIYAAFWKHYGVNLSEVSLHWWEFRALLEGLLSHSFRQRVYYRTVGLEGMDAQERAQTLRYRALYRLSSAKSLEEHLKELDEIVSRHAEHNNDDLFKVT